MNYKANETSSQVDTILSKLNKVRKTGQGRWLACCPAHDDKSPSLAIRKTDDGTVLMHCFAGCDIASITTALGLDPSQLFPKRTEAHSVKGKSHFDAYAALKALSADILLILVAARMVIKKEPLSDSDLAKLSDAAFRLQEANSFVRGGK